MEEYSTIDEHVGLVTMLSSSRSNRLNCMVVINLSNSVVMSSWNRPTDRNS